MPLSAEALLALFCFNYSRWSFSSLNLYRRFYVIDVSMLSGDIPP